MTQETTWTVVGSTALGGRHVRTGTPNQDASNWQTVTADDGEVTVMAVADGHGGARYVRSDTGSRLAVEIACHVAAESVQRGLLAGSPRQIEQALLKQLAPAIVERWNSACLDDLAAKPFIHEERARAEEPLDDEPLLSYGSTLLMAILGRKHSVLLQLGDGDCLVAAIDGSALSPIPPDPRLTGGETTSLCLPTAVADFRVAVVSEDNPVLVVLATDGYGVAFADPSWRQTVVEDLLREFRHRGHGYIEGMLPRWLGESAQVGGDDATALVAFRSNGAVGEARSPAERSDRSVSKAGLVVATALICLVAGGVAGWALGAIWPPSVGGSSTTALTSSTVSVSTTQGTVPEVAVTNPTTTVNSAPEGGSSGPRDDALQMASIVGFDGTIVEFLPDPEEPNPMLHPDASEVLIPARTVYLLGLTWSIELGQLYAEGADVLVDTNPSVTLEVLEAENGYLWALTEGNEWLIAFDSNDPSTCWLHVVEGGLSSVEGAPDQQEVEPACSFTISRD